MSAQTDGGPAFPAQQDQHPDGSWNQSFECGMSMRDYFAAKAMQAYIGYLTSRDVVLSRCHSEIAEESFNIADAMLAERQKGAVKE